MIIIFTILFIQVYIVFAEMASTKVIPAAFALLPGKSKEVYRKMWSVIFQHVTEYIPETLLLDMEAAAANSFVEIFGDTVDIVYCYFHWRKALIENLRKKGAWVEVTKSKPFNKLYRLIKSLAFVPPEDMHDVITEVISPYVDKVEGELTDDSLNWCEYFVNTYVGGVNPRTGRRRAATIPPDYWSQFYTVKNEKPYTTNSCEGFNSAWNASRYIYIYVIYNSVLYCIVVLCTILYCSIMYYTTLYYIIVYNNIL